MISNKWVGAEYKISRSLALDHRKQAQQAISEPFEEIRIAEVFGVILAETSGIYNSTLVDIDGNVR